SDFSDRQGVLILADRKCAIGYGRQIRSRQDRVNARISLRLRNINADDAGMRNGTSQKLRVQHTWKKQIVCIFQLADAFCFRIDLDEGLSYDTQPALASIIPSHKSSPWRARLGRQPCAQPPIPPLPVF